MVAQSSATEENLERVAQLRCRSFSPPLWQGPDQGQVALSSGSLQCSSAAAAETRLV